MFGARAAHLEQPTTQTDALEVPLVVYVRDPYDDTEPGPSSTTGSPERRPPGW